MAGNSAKYGTDNPHPLSTRKTELVWEGKYDVGSERERQRLQRYWERG